MTDWETTVDVAGMLYAVRGIASDRQLLLFACGCCRLVEAKLPVVRFLAARFEKDAERPMSTDEKWSILSAVGSALLGDVHPIVRQFLMGRESDPWSLAANVARICRTIETREIPDLGAMSDDRQLLPSSPAQAATLREIVANPAWPRDFDPRWRTEAVRGIAAAIAESRAWDRMPILADALQDAGCEDDRILGHCRREELQHRPGCWVLDRVLGRT